MKQKSIALTIRDIIWDMAKSPGPEGKPIGRLMHLQRLKLNRKETGTVACFYQYKDKWGTARPKTLLFTIDKRGRIAFQPTRPERADLLDDRLSLLNQRVQTQLSKTYPNLKFSFGTYDREVSIHIDRGDPTEEQKAAVIQEQKDRTYGYVHDWIQGIKSYSVQGDDVGRVKSDEEIWERFGKDRYELHYRWERTLNAKWQSRWESLPQVTLVPSTKAEAGYLVKTDVAKPVKAPAVEPGLTKIPKRRFFKVMDESGKTGYAGHVWDLPKANNGGDTICGDWLEVKSTLRMCNNGIHVCTPDQLHNWCGNGRSTIVVEMEIAGQVYSDGSSNKYLCRKARVKRIVGKLSGEDFDALKDAFGFPTAVTMVAKGQTKKKIFRVDASRVITRTEAQSFAATSLKEAKRKAAEWAGYTPYSNTGETIGKVVIKRVDNAS